MVPTFTWGFFRSNTPLAIAVLPLLTRGRLLFHLPTEGGCRGRFSGSPRSKRRPDYQHSGHKPLMGLEPMTSPLPRECSTTELQRRKHAGEALPTERAS